MAACMITYKVSAFGLSDKGLVRENNEDVWVALPDLNFYILADGMGGHQAGEVAAREAVKELSEIAKITWGHGAKKHSFHDMRKIMKLAIEQVNTAIFKMGRSNAPLRGMGTTLCCVHFHDKGVVYAHVGDSRIYRFRHHKLEQLTKDHSLYRELVDQGHLPEQQMPVYLYKNIITKAIGTESYVEPSVHLTDIEDGDLYLMCTDGLSDLMTTKEIQNVIAQGGSLEECVKELIAIVNARGGHDNVTIVMMKVLRTDE